MTILVVDDKAEGRYMLESLLKGSGYEVISAGNGVEALGRVREESIDMIISDILMPKMDGFQLCRECKKDDSLRKIPFLFYSATYTGKKDEEFALSLGAVRFLLKPIEPDEFLKTVEGVIEERNRGTFVAPEVAIKEEELFLAEYNERLARQLEHKVRELERDITKRKLVEAKLQERMSELERFQAATIGREFRIKELRDEIAGLKTERGKE